MKIDSATAAVVTGGASGLGRATAEALAAAAGLRLDGASPRAVELPDPKLSPIHSWHSASSGVIRSAGSHRRHPSRKLKNARSPHRTALDKSLEFGLRFFPRLFATMRGCIEPGSKNIFLRVEFSTMCLGGSPITSMMQANCSSSFSPGKRG